MPGHRKRYSADLKAKIAEDSIKAQKTANEIAAEYGVHPSQIAQWKKQALDGLPDLFSTRGADQVRREEALIASLYQQIGHVIRAGGLVGKKIKTAALRPSGHRLRQGILI